MALGSARAVWRSTQGVLLVPYRAKEYGPCPQAYELRGAGAVIHSHSINAVMATLVEPTATEFSVTHLEMIKGLAGHGFYDQLVRSLGLLLHEHGLSCEACRAWVDPPKKVGCLTSVWCCARSFRSSRTQRASAS